LVKTMGVILGELEAALSRGSSLEGNSDHCYYRPTAKSQTRPHRSATSAQPKDPKAAPALKAETIPPIADGVGLSK
jgi:hypothetical protein